VSAKLSEQQIRFFRHAGYIRLPRIIGSAEISAMRDILEDHTTRSVQPVRRRADGLVFRLDDVWSRSEIFRAAWTSAPMLDVLVSLLGPNIHMTLNRHNHATFNRRGDSIVRLHRDVLQWSRSVVTAVLYLDDSTPQTGCTHLIPGSHLLPFVGTPNNGGTWMDEHSVYSDMTSQSLPVPMESGGVLLFDSLVFHTVGENSTSQSRTSVCMAFHSVDELSRADDPAKVLICGTLIYRGNDSLG
jgi:phytanoyl-CoA hydroxylase